MEFENKEQIAVFIERHLKELGGEAYGVPFISNKLWEWHEAELKNLRLGLVVECADKKPTASEKSKEVLSNPLWEYKAGLYKHFKWGWKTLDEAYQIVTS
jgi:hypothetical protein